MTTSGITILPPNYDASVSAPFISGAVSAADLKSPVVPGGLMAVLGTNLSGTNEATSEVPLPTTIADSCLTVNGAPTHMLFVSPTQVNAQMPSQVSGNVALVMHTPGGVSNTYFLTLLTGAPSVFLMTLDGVDNVPAIVRWNNGLVVTSTNPVHRGDILTIYLTGLGAVDPPVDDGSAGLVDPLSRTLGQSDRQDRRRGCRGAVFRLGPGNAGSVCAECERLQLNAARLECTAHNFTERLHLFAERARRSEMTSRN